MATSATVVVDSSSVTFVVLVLGGGVFIGSLSVVVGSLSVVVGSLSVVVGSLSVVVGSLSVRGFSSGLQETANNRKAERTYIFRINKLATNFYFSK